MGIVRHGDFRLISDVAQVIDLAGIDAERLKMDFGDRDEMGAVFFIEFLEIGEMLEKFASSSPDSRALLGMM